MEKGGQNWVDVVGESAGVNVANYAVGAGSMCRATAWPNFLTTYPKLPFGLGEQVQNFVSETKPLAGKTAGIVW